MLAYFRYILYKVRKESNMQIFPGIASNASGSLIADAQQLSIKMLE